MQRKSSYYRRRKKTNKQKPILAIIGVLAALVLTIVLCLTLRPSKTPAPSAPETETQTPALPTVSLPLPQTFVDNNTSAEYIVLYDATNNKTLYSKNADKQCFPASTTKLMTALVTLQYADENTVFTVGNEVLMIDPESSRAWLRMGNRLNLQTLLEALMLPSGNDAAYTAAANVGRIIAGDSNLSAQAA
ncbi:MAG: D-alanyl-D-alanine carboxypeptidase, partial [Clostridia bacterium]|nr:D-alanyl-D-alanine carboxypeptidase [Clostridia bacterium]